MSTRQIRKFKSSDSKVVSDIMLRAFRSFLGDKMCRHIERSFSPHVLARVSNVRNHDRLVISYVAEDKGKVIGYIRGSASVCGLGTLEVIGIDQDSVHHGVGTLLMGALEKFWTQTKMRKASTCVSAHNTRAFMFYIKNGFIPEGIFRDHYIDGVDEIMLAKRLLSAEK